MNTKAFVGLLVAVLVLGGSLGGAFAGGIAVGKSQGETQAQTTLLTQAGSQPSSQQQLDQFRQQRPGQLGQDAGGLGFADRGGLTGTIEKIEGSTLTVNTAQGPLQATIGASTAIQRFAEGTLEDLLAGVQVTVTGQRGEDGTVEATSILITPEGVGGLPGTFFGGRQQSEQQQP